jgi:hypothetical protein
METAAGTGDRVTRVRSVRACMRALFQSSCPGDGRFTFADIGHDFALQHEIAGNGFPALYQKFLETEIATLALRLRF